MSANPSQPATDTGDSARGFSFALVAYLLWGFLPVFMKTVAHIPVAEIIAHRILWSVPIAGSVLVILGRMPDVRAALRSPRTIAMTCVTAFFVTVNWGIYVWSISHNRAIESAFGYYINPLFSVFLGAVLLKESLQKLQIVAIALAASAVAILAWESSGIPWISLGLAVSWGFYAFFRKTLPVGPNEGFFLEVLILSVPAFAYMLYLQASGQGHFAGPSLSDSLLLICCGFITAGPLMIYANGAKLLKLSTIGIMQYIAPTMIFITAIFLFHEPFSHIKMIAFALIWAALVLYTWSMFFTHRASKPARLSGPSRTVDET